MSAPLSVVGSGLNHDDDTLNVCDPPEGGPIGFGEGTSASGPVRVGWGVSEDNLSEKEPWPEWYRWLKHRSQDTWAIVSRHTHIPLPEVWF